MEHCKRLLCLLLSLCMLCGIASAELVTDEEDWSLGDVELLTEDDGEEAVLIAEDDEDDDDLSGFRMDEETSEELDEQWEVDETIDPDDLSLNKNLPDNVVNILLIGIDSRSKDMTEGYQRGDVQIILSLNTDTGSVKLTSVMRDLYVSIPGYKNKARINEAYGRGGGQLAMKTLNSLFELNIQYYVTINFYGLASIIDAIGGIDIELTKTEASAINAYLKKHPPAYDNKAKGERVALEKVKGVQHLDGVQAVMYARLREIDNDFKRTERQRNLLDLLLKKIMANMDMSVMLNLINTTLPYVKTNVPASTIASLATKVMGPLMTKLQEGSSSLIEQMRIPMGDGSEATWKYDKSSSGASVIVFRTVARREENVKALHEFIYGRYIPAE